MFNTSAKKRLDDLEQTKAEIETAIYSEQLQKPEITKEHILCYIERYRKINVNDLESRKRLIDTFVNSIYLYDDKIVFAFNYKDGTKSVSLAELEEELSSDLDGATPPLRGYTHIPLKEKPTFGFFFFCAVFTVIAVSVGIVGENQVQKQLVFLSAFQVEQNFHFIVVKHNVIQLIKIAT